MQDPPPPPPPSAWVQEIERETPRVDDIVVVASRASRYEPSAIEREHLNRLERQFGPSRCQIRIEPYAGSNPLWRSLFATPLYRECGYTVTTPDSHNRPSTPYDE